MRARFGQLDIVSYDTSLKGFTSTRRACHHGRAWDLYLAIVASGLKPDAILLSGLPCFSEGCGRAEPSRGLSRLAPRQDIQNYVALTRAASRGKGAGRTYDHLGMLERSGGMPDSALCYFVLDACICAGDVARANDVASIMQARFSRLDIVSYRALLKGFASSGDLTAAFAAV